MEIDEEQSDINEENEENEENNGEDIENKYEYDDLMKINTEKYKNMENISIKENEDIKNEIIEFYIQNHENNITNEEYLKYLNNEQYKCEFCGEKFNNFDKNERFYKCINDDITFSCCFTKMPINNNFLWCSYCRLFYSNELKIYYCIVCDKILNNLDSI